MTRIPYTSIYDQRFSIRNFIYVFPTLIATYNFVDYVVKTWKLIHDFVIRLKSVNQNYT